jgi:hypothetical protein
MLWGAILPERREDMNSQRFSLDKLLLLRALELLIIDEIVWFAPIYLITSIGRCGNFDFR